MGTSASKPSPLPSLNPPKSESNDTNGGATPSPHPDPKSRPGAKPTTRNEGKRTARKKRNKGNTAIAAESRKVKRLAKTDTTGTPPPATSAAVSAAAAAAAAAATSGTARSPAMFTYEAVAPFLRGEGWKCADGHGFHTWFFVTEAADGKKSVDYLVSEKEVVAFVRRDQSILARYEAYRQVHTVAAEIGRSKQDGGGVEGLAGRAVVGARSPSESSGGGREGGGARGSSSAPVSARAGCLPKDATTVRGGSRVPAKSRRNKESPIVGAAKASTSARSPKEAPVAVARTSTKSSSRPLQVAPTAGVASTSTGGSATEAPTARATRTSGRVGRSAKYNLLVKPAEASTGSAPPTKASPNMERATSSSTAGGGQATPAAVPVVKGHVGLKAAKLAARPSMAALGGPVKHSEVVRAAAAAAERAVGLGLPAVTQRAHQRALPQEPSETTFDWAGRAKAKAPGTSTLPPAVDWAGREKSRAPGGAATPSFPTAKYSRAEIGVRAAAGSPRRSASAPAPPRPIGSGWAGTGAARAHHAGGGHRQQYAGPLGSRKRSREVTANWAQIWRETWPALREEGWHWEYGDDLGESCVYLKPGVLRVGATLGLDMFDSRRAVIQHVQDSASGAAAGGATGDSATGPPTNDESRCHARTQEPSVDEHARATRSKLFGGNSKPRLDASNRGSPAEELERGDSQEKEEECRSSELSFSSASSQAAPGPVVRRAPGPPSQEPGAGMRSKELLETAGGGDAPADNEDDIQLAAAVVMEMLRAETTREAAAEPLAKRRVGFGSSGSRRKNKLDTATAGPAGAPWGVDKLTVHCCEQLVALSELGGVIGEPGGVGGSDGRAGAGSNTSGGSVDGDEDPTLKRKASRQPGSPPQDAERDGESAKKLKEAASPAAWKSGKGSGGSLTALGLPGPLASVGVVVSGVRGEGRKDIEAKTISLGGEVVDVFQQNGISDGWRASLLGEAGAAAEGGSAASNAGKGGRGFNGPSARTMMSVAEAGSDHTPEFLLAVAAGIPIVHPSYLDACSRTGYKVDTAGYLMPFGRSALASREIIVPSSSNRDRPFQGKIIILCLTDLVAATDETAVEDWVIIFGIAGATVKVLKDGSGGGSGGWVGAAAAAATNGTKADNRCTVEEARHLLATGHVHCVIGTSNDGAPRASPAAAAVLQAAEDAGIPAGTLDWAAQCLAHGRLLLASADTCPWFPAGEVAEGDSSGRTTLTATDGGGGHGGCGGGGGGGGAPKEKAGCSPSVSSCGPAGVFHVHVSGARRYVSGDYVFLGNQHDVPGHVGGRGSAGTAIGAAARAGGGGGSILPVARVVSFRREVDGTVKATVEVMDRGEDPKILVAGAGGDEQREVGESMLGGRVLVLTRAEAEAAELYSSKDSGIFCLGD